VESLIWAIQDFLPLHASLYRIVNIVRQFKPADALGEARSRILGRLKKARNNRGLEYTEESRLLI
jgi:hypothetical protein